MMLSCPLLQPMIILLELINEPDTGSFPNCANGKENLDKIYPISFRAKEIKKRISIYCFIKKRANMLVLFYDINLSHKTLHRIHLVYKDLEVQSLIKLYYYYNLLLKL
jgi:hypothetical protein